jgi:hypothetical protein
MVVDDFADVSEEEYSSETLASTTSTSRCKNPRVESPSVMNHHASLKADIYIYIYIYIYYIQFVKRIGKRSM